MKESNSRRRDYVTNQRGWRKSSNEGGTARKTLAPGREFFVLGRKMDREMRLKVKNLLGTQRDVVISQTEERKILEEIFTGFFSPGDTILCTVMGEDGNRETTVIESLGIETFRIGSPWGETITLEDVTFILENEGREKIRGIFVTHHETSTGVIADTKSIIRKCVGRDILSVVSVLEGVEILGIAMDEWKVDVLAAEIAPDVWAWSKSQRADQRLKERPRLSSNPCLLENEEFSPFLPSEVLKESWEEKSLAYHKVTTMVRAGIKTMGLELLVKKEEIASPIFTTFLLPQDIQGTRITEELCQEGIQGIQRQKNQTLRIDHRKYQEVEKIIHLLEALGTILQKQGVPLKVSAGIKRVWEVYKNE